MANQASRMERLRWYRNFVTSQQQVPECFVPSIPKPVMFECTSDGQSAGTAALRARATLLAKFGANLGNIDKEVADALQRRRREGRSSEEGVMSGRLRYSRLRRNEKRIGRRRKGLRTRLQRKKSKRMIRNR
jgi:hypothetical protein